MSKFKIYFTPLLFILLPSISLALAPPPDPVYTLISDEIVLSYSVEEDRIELSWNNMADVESYRVVRSGALGDAQGYEIGDIVGDYGDNWDVIEAYGAWHEFEVNTNTYTDFYPLHDTNYYAICYWSDESPWDYGWVCSLPTAIEYEGGQYIKNENLNLELAFEEDEMLLTWDTFGKESENYHYQLHKTYSDFENETDSHSFYYHSRKGKYFDDEARLYSESPVPKRTMSYMICTHDGINNECTQPLTIYPQGGEVILTNELNFKVEINHGLVDLSWDQYEPEEFHEYRMVRQEIDPDTWTGDMDSVELIWKGSDLAHQDKLDYNTERHFAYQICAEAHPNTYCSEPVSIKYTPTIVMVDHLFLRTTLQPEGEIFLEWNQYKPEKFEHYRILRYPPDESISLEEALREYDYFSFSDREWDVHPWGNWEYYNGNNIYWEEQKNFVDRYSSLNFAVCAYTQEDVHYCGKVVDYLDDFDLPLNFPDTKNHPYSQAIAELRLNRVINGHPDGSFKPDELINRAEFSKIVMGDHYGMELDLGAKNLEGCFPDVPDTWFEEVVCLAAQKSIITGHPDGFFKPADTINFAEAAKILTLTYNLPLAPEYGQWYENDIDALEKRGYTPPSVASPDQPLTRAEMAYMVWSIKNTNE